MKWTKNFLLFNLITLILLISRQNVPAQQTGEIKGQIGKTFRAGGNHLKGFGEQGLELIAVAAVRT